MMVDNSKIGHLLRLYFSGTISPGEQKELDRWLTENEEHRAFSNTFGRILVLLPSIACFGTLIRKERGCVSVRIMD